MLVKIIKILQKQTNKQKTRIWPCMIEKYRKRYYEI